MLYYKWPAEVVGKMYVDDLDHEGILWHYNQIKAIQDSYKNKGKK